MLARLRALAAEVTRVTLEVGSQGKLGGQAHVPGVEGVWLNLVRNVSIFSTMLLLNGFSSIYRSIGCVLLLQIKFGVSRSRIGYGLIVVVGTVNSMVDQLSAFASEVTRVALEAGTQGILGGQARVEGVQGTWADLSTYVKLRLSHTNTSLQCKRLSCQRLQLRVLLEHAVYLAVSTNPSPTTKVREKRSLLHVYLSLFNHTAALHCSKR